MGAACDVVITMLPNGHIVRQVVLGESGGDSLAERPRTGLTVVDMSSSDPIGTRALGIELEKYGRYLLDAPVSGSIRGAVAGTLSIMVGGDSALAQRLDPVLATMGRRFLVGALGSGHAAKALNNFVSAAGLAAAAEAVAVGSRFGIEPQTLIDILNASTGRNNSTENKFSQYILNGAYNSGFSLALMVKDIGLAISTAQACHVPAPLGHACLGLWQDALSGLDADADHTEIAKYVNSLADEKAVAGSIPS
jgi:3-hydroxyisobutyrate dehydrogenase